MTAKKKTPAPVKAEKKGTFRIAVIGKPGVELPAGTKLVKCLETLGIASTEGYVGKRDGTPFNLSDMDTHFNADEVITIAKDIRGG